MQTDDQIVEHLRSTNADFQVVEESHHRLDAELQRLLQNHTLTPQEEVIKKELQKEKLGLKDQMAAMIREYRACEEHTTA